MDSSYDDTVDIHRSISDEMSRLMFGAPPNTEDEGNSDYPGTDGSLTDKLGRCPSEAMSDRNEDMTYSEMTDSDSDSNSDIVGFFGRLIDFGSYEGVETPSALSWSGDLTNEGLCPGPADSAGEGQEQS